MTPARRILAEKRRYIYPLVGALLLNIALLLVVVLPLSRKVQGGEQAAQQAAMAHAAANKDFQAARATVSGKSSADGELKKFYSAVLPTDMSQARRTMFKVSEMVRNARTLEHEGVPGPGQLARQADERPDAHGTVPRYQAVHLRSRDVTRVPRARARRPVVAGDRRRWSAENGRARRDLLPGGRQ
jgi:hypothetical protein